MPQRLEWTPELTQRFWDVLARERPETFFTYQRGHLIVEAARPYLPDTGDVLDFGCGAGFLIPHLLRGGWTVHGTDLSREGVDTANRRYATEPGFGGAWTPDQMPDRTYDAIFSVELVEHLHDHELEDVTETLFKLLAPGGRLVITTPNDEDIRASEVYCPVSDLWFHPWQHVRSWTAQTLSDHLVAHGFTIVEALETNFAWYRESDLISRAARRVNRWLGRLPRPPHLVVVATR